MKSILILISLLGITLPSAHSRHVPFYRKDYTYIEHFDAFYKVHWDISGTNWNLAFLTCEDEGALLFYPKAQGEWALVKNLTEMMTEVPNVTEIFVGFHNEFNLGEFVTVDGYSTPYPLNVHSPLSDPNLDNCVTMSIDTGKFHEDSCTRTTSTPLPFVCKKTEDESCPTIDKGYKYIKSSHKCYKVNNKPQTWQGAMKTCFMEGGILAVIEDSAQARDVYNMVDGSPEYFVGVRRLFSQSDYYTVKGHKFSDMYSLSYNDQNGDCGTVSSRNSDRIYTSTADCDQRLPFICEMEAQK
ncbi:unnamed protein product [Spodoptera exigua]|uniref:C-type lectin domain-containing protein n=1 Tax=Spodoptera exigua TaxID=7107 RepID=A0A922MHE8_SPOEX|nr:hypothetical protein HF086_010647 [Spodoptera exigua]CAH0686111.1 unnamed protein product [Spodoptera exigua]